MPHTYRTPTHPSQSSPLSPGKASVTDMTTCNGYIHFFLSTPKWALKGWFGGRNVDPMSVIYHEYMWWRVKGVAVKS